MPAKLETSECDEFFANNNSSNTSDKLVEEFRRKIRISLQDAPSNLDENDGRLGTNTTERVPVPSSEHVAEIVGRQGTLNIKLFYLHIYLKFYGVNFLFKYLPFHACMY